MNYLSRLSFAFFLLFCTTFIAVAAHSSKPQENMDQYLLHNQLTAKDGQVDQLAEILLKASELMSRARGCQLYVVSKDADHPNTVYITEIWASKTDHDFSLQEEQVRALIMKAMPLLAEPPQKGQELSFLGGYGI